MGEREGVAPMDEKRPMVFEDLPVGEEYADEYVLTPELARDYAEGVRTRRLAALSPTRS